MTTKTNQSALALTAAIFTATLLASTSIPAYASHFLGHGPAIPQNANPSHGQKGGIGGRLLSHLRKLAHGPVLIGTWANAVWAIRFYEKHGFHLVTPEQKEQLLRRYWKISERQMETSVVLADQSWQGRTRSFNS